jgi:basic amino acid/polyamine antiporter, APA family
MTETPAGQLRRELGRIESYALLIGIVVGAGIFRVTSDAWALTGPSVILGYLALAPAVLATSVPYAVFLSTPLGLLPGGEYAHISRTFGSARLAFVGAWIKIIAYLGALAFLANTFADYVLELGTGTGHTPAHDPHGSALALLLSLAVLAFFLAVHARGVRWLGSLQVFMCLLLAVSILVLVLPECFAIDPANYRPLFTGGARGFAAALPPLFFAYAGFESLAQAAAEVRDSTRQLPRVFLRGLLVTTLVFASMSMVAFGVLPGERLRGSPTPMADVARVYLPRGGAFLVILGALMAITTSINATMLVPSRLAVMLATDGMAPAWLGHVHPRTGTPVRALVLTFAVAALLLVSRQVWLALEIAVLSMVLLYLLHSVALLAVPRCNPALFRSRTVRTPGWVLWGSALFSVAAMAGLVGVMVVRDVRTLRAHALAERLASGHLTSLELLLGWGALGFVLHALAIRQGERAGRAHEAA